MNGNSGRARLARFLRLASLVSDVFHQTLGSTFDAKARNEPKSKFFQMVAISSVNGLFFRVALLFSISFFCFKDVNSILQNSYVLVLGQAMNLPTLTMSQYNAQLGLFGILFLFSSVSDLIPLLEGNKKYFNSIVPFRLFIFFILTALSYLWESNLYLHNNAVFIYSFIEVWINFIVFGALREERNDEFKRSNQFASEQRIIEVEEEDEEDEEPILTSVQEIEQIMMEDEDVDE